MMRSQGIEADRKLVALHFLIFGLIVGTFTANIPYIQTEQAFDLTDVGHLILSVNLGNVIGIYIGRQGCFTTKTLFKTKAAALVLGLSGVSVAHGKAQCIVAGLVLGTGSGLLEMFVNSGAALIESRYGMLVLPKMHAEFSKGVLLGALGSLLAAFSQLPYELGFILLIGPIVVGSRIAFAAPSALFLSDVDRVVPSAGPDVQRHRRVLAILGTVAFTCIMVEGALMGWSGILLKDGLQVPQGLLPLGVLMFTMFSFLIRRRGDRLIAACGGRPRALALSLFVAAAVSVVLGFLSNAWLGLAAVAVIGMSTALIIPIVISLAGSLVANAKRQLISDISLIGYAASILGPSFMALLASRYGIKASLSCLAFGLVAGLLVLAVGRAVVTATDTVSQLGERPSR